MKDHKLLKKAFMDIYCGKIKIKLNEKEKRLAKKLEVELTKLFLNNKIIKHGGAPEYRKTGIFANIRRSLGKYFEEEKEQIRKEKEQEEEKEFANNPLTQQDMEELFNYEESVSPGFRKRNQLYRIPNSNNVYIKPNTGEKYQLLQQPNGQKFMAPMPIDTKIDSDTNKHMYIYDNEKKWDYENPQERNTSLRIAQHKKLRDFRKQNDQSLVARKLQNVMTLQYGPSGYRGPSGPSGNINHYSNEREPLTRNSDLYYELVDNERKRAEEKKLRLAEEEKRKRAEEEDKRRLAEEEEEEKKRRFAEERKRRGMERERGRLAKKEEEENRRFAEEGRRRGMERDRGRLAEEEEEYRRWTEDAEGNAMRLAHEHKIIFAGKRKSKKTRKN